jgi:GNAT superfamily N-acetyltransferase
MLSVPILNLYSQLAGTKVKITAKQLRQQILPKGPENEISNIYIRMKINNILVGNLFAQYYMYNEHDVSVIWITQLCVHRDFRNQGIAKQILSCLLPYHCKWSHGKDMGTPIGILSSHPFAIVAVLEVFAEGLKELLTYPTNEDYALEMTKDHASWAMETCPVSCVRNAKLRGKMFDEDKKTRKTADSRALFYALTRTSGSIIKRVLRQSRSSRKRDWLGRLESYQTDVNLC